MVGTPPTTSVHDQLLLGGRVVAVTTVSSTLALILAGGVLGCKEGNGEPRKMLAVDATRGRGSCEEGPAH